MYSRVSNSMDDSVFDSDLLISVYRTISDTTDQLVEW